MNLTFLTISGYHSLERCSDATGCLYSRYQSTLLSTGAGCKLPEIAESLPGATFCEKLPPAPRMTSGLKTERSLQEQQSSCQNSCPICGNGHLNGVITLGPGSMSGAGFDPGFAGMTEKTRVKVSLSDCASWLTEWTLLLATNLNMRGGSCLSGS
jgi:hypothetical protein